MIYFLIGFCILSYALAVVIMFTTQKDKDIDYRDVLLITFSPIWVFIVLIQLIFSIRIGK